MYEVIANIALIIYIKETTSKSCSLVVSLFQDTNDHSIAQKYFRLASLGSRASSAAVYCRTKEFVRASSYT
jgi:hypothetical protein